MAMFAPSELKATDQPLYVTVEGSEYLVPKPEFQGYAVTWGVLSRPKAISDPSGLKATPAPSYPGKVEGSEYLETKPEENLYTLM